MRLALLMSVAMMSMSPTLSFAEGCGCSTQCMKDCKAGKHVDCKCTKCKCKNEKADAEKCDGHCETEHKH